MELKFSPIQAALDTLSDDSGAVLITVTEQGANLCGVSTSPQEALVLLYAIILESMPLRDSADLLRTMMRQFEIRTAFEAEKPPALLVPKGRTH